MFAAYAMLANEPTLETKNATVNMAESIFFIGICTKSISWRY